MKASLLELAEEPGLWLPAAPEHGATRVDGFSVLRTEGYAFVTYGRSAWVQRLRLAADEVAIAVEDVRALLRERRLEEATWWVGERSTPEDVAQRLAALGLEADDPPEMTTLTIATRPGGSPSVEVRRAETLEDTLAALEIDWEAFAVPAAERETRRAEAAAALPLIQADGRQSTYIAYLDGSAVGFGRAVFSPHGALLLGGATLPAARGRGVYTSLVHARWDEAAERGVPRLTVSAGPMSAPILERLGFERIGTVRLLRDRL